MTIAQQLERKGFEKRWQEGIHRGMKKCMLRCKEEGILLDIHAVARLFLQEGLQYGNANNRPG